MLKAKRQNKQIGWWVLAVFLITIYCSHGQNSATDPSADSGFKISHGSKGFVFQSQDDRFELRIQSRFQFRYATPRDQDPVTFTDFGLDEGQVFKINRARLKVGGHAYQPWLKYYWEYEIGRGSLLDFRIMIEKWSWLKFKFGQWKVEYSRERRISSGAQQLVDRSIINRPFTVDRQQGVEVYGDLKGEGILDFSYWVAVLTGTGRSARINDDGHLMYFGRFQWQFFGRPFKFEGSDQDITSKPTGAISVSAVTNRSQYTRFSSAGGGELEGFDSDNPGQYRINQFNFETAFKYSGFSWQTEWHHKEIIDKLNNNKTSNLSGYFIQMGYMMNQAIKWWPEPLEVAVRHARYTPNEELNKRRQLESSLAFNYFFQGHKNKLTAEVSRFDLKVPDGVSENEWRFRVQWDISL